MIMPVVLGLPYELGFACPFVVLGFIIYVIAKK